MHGKLYLTSLLIFCGIILNFASSVSSTTTCADNPCQNGGKCMNYNGNYFCVCNHGFVGQDCEIDIDECVSAPCQHQGTCVNKVNSYECICPEGYTGVNCDS
ncbi:neurocan core protein-like [Amphiura filiformis]|uniref:neurocan core protein-like n=1 Tax=Amphiura filiformis TaxID=82378 RepID=UPI003B225D12